MMLQSSKEIWDRGQGGGKCLLAHPSACKELHLTFRIVDFENPKGSYLETKSHCVSVCLSADAKLFTLQVEF